MIHDAVGCLLVSGDIGSAVLFLRRFGLRLKLFRAARGLTQAQLAKAAGMDRTFIGRLERGQTGMDVDRLEDLAEALGVTGRDVIPRDDG